MVSTRQMTNVSSGSNDAPENGAGPAKSTRNSTSTAVSTIRYSPPAATTNMQLLNLPQEIMEKIFGYLNYKNVCQLRLVCRTFNNYCAHILNFTFQRLQGQMLQRFQAIKNKMPRRESARRTHPLATECDIIETLHMRLTLLQMSFGKHIERKHCCFFPGEILDEVYNILHYIKVTAKLPRPYNVTDELFDLSTMAMEYFKEKIEPELPEIAYFGSEFFNFPNNFSATSPHHLSIDSSPMGPDQSKDTSHSSHDGCLDGEDMEEIKPQSNMVLRKGIRKIKQGMKRYNSQLTILRQDLKSCKRKTAEQQNQIADQQKQLAEQQQQTLEYASRLDEYDKKNEEISRKFSTLLQELNKCKTELQYWRSKSSATPPFCTSCGNAIGPQPEELEALVNQGVNPMGLGLEPDFGDLLCEETFDPKPEFSDNSSGNSKDEVVPLVPTERIVLPPPTATTFTKSNKRKLEETTREPLATPGSSSSNNHSKKTRRHSKLRSKRLKI